jgi:hypothetical protein
VRSAACSPWPQFNLVIYRGCTSMLSSSAFLPWLAARGSSLHAVAPWAVILKVGLAKRDRRYLRKILRCCLAFPDGAGLFRDEAHRARVLVKVC